MGSLTEGDVVAARILTTAFDSEVALPDQERLVHLQFRRYAGCPICNVHLRSVAARLPEIEAAGVREVVVFHSSAEELRDYAESLPFDAIPDPERTLYREFGIESSATGVLRPAVIKAALGGFRKGALMEQLAPNRSHFGLPGDFLIAPDGHIVASHHGRHAADQWSVDEIVALAEAHRS